MVNSKTIIYGSLNTFWATKFSNWHKEPIMVWNLSIRVHILRLKVISKKSYDINILSMCICIYICVYVYRIQYYIIIFIIIGTYNSSHSLYYSLVISTFYFYLGKIITVHCISTGNGFSIRESKYHLVNTFNDWYSFAIIIMDSWDSLMWRKRIHTTLDLNWIQGFTASN